LLGGYGQSLPLGQGGNLTLFLYTANRRVHEFQLTMDGVDTGIRVRDDGSAGDQAAGDGLFTWSVPVDGPVPPGQYLLEASAVDDCGDLVRWPRLDVDVLATALLAAPFPPRRTTADGGPAVFAAGFGQTDVTFLRGGTLQILALIVDDQGTARTSVELHYDGLPTGVFLLDDGSQGDYQADDGIYGYQITLGPNQLPPNAYLFELLARDAEGKSSALWPYLEVVEVQ
jgi:hypothetical protein